MENERLLNEEQITTQEDIDNERKYMIEYDESFDYINLEDKNIKFVDKDNYDMFLKIKSKNGFIKKIIQRYGVFIYILVLMVFVTLQVFHLILPKFIKNLIDTLDMELPQPKWSLLITPIIFAKLIQSFNTFSMIKISF